MSESVAGRVQNRRHEVDVVREQRLGGIRSECGAHRPHRRAQGVRPVHAPGESEPEIVRGRASGTRQIHRPRDLLGEDVAAGRLVPVLEEYLPAPRPVSLVYPRDRLATPKMTTFIAFMLERFGTQAGKKRG